MLGYLVHRILIMIPTLIAISLLIFIIIHLPPGDYFSTYIAELQSQGEKANLAKIAFLKAQYGFDRPLWEQYLFWVGGLIQGDMGYSFLYDLPVNRVVGDRLFLTFLVSFTTIVFTYLVAFPIGVYSATHQYSLADYVLTFFGFLGLASLLPHVISGAAVVSIVMSLPTTGPMLLDALRSQDMFLAGSFLMFMAALTVIGVFLSDLALAALDPRIRLHVGRQT